MAQGGGEGKGDSSSDAILLVGVFLIAIMGVGYFFGETLTMIWWKWKYIEGSVISFVMPEGFSVHMAMKKMVSVLTEGDFKKITMDQSLALGDVIGSYMRWPLGGLIGYYGYRVWQKSPLHKLRHNYSMQKLLESEVRNWPQIAPVVKLDLIKESPEEGKWAMSVTPLAFARKNRLLDDANLLLRKRAERVFCSQLGKMWQGPEKLPMHTRAMFAVFIAFGANDKDGANNGLDKMSLSYASSGGDMKKMDFSWVKPLLEKHYNDTVKAVAEKHAYVYTVMASMLVFARRKGVLASSSFLWLRPADRVLWYLLNNVGRNVAWTEVAGIYGHWKAEQVAGHAIERPYVIKAVDGLEEAIKNIKF